MLRFIGSSTLLQELLCALIALAFWTGLARTGERIQERLLLAHVVALLAWPTAFSILTGSLSAPSSTFADVGLQYGPAMFTAWLLLMRAKGEDRLNPGVFVVALVPVMSIVYALETGQAAAWSVAWLAMASPAFFARRASGGYEAIVRGFQLSVVSVWLLILTLAVLRPTQTFQSCRLDKCSVIGTFLAPGGVSNGLGVTFALLLPIVVFNLRLRQAVVVSAAGLLVVDYTGSRSALIAGVAGVGFAAIYRMRRSELRRALIASATLVILVASLVPALRSFPAQTATDRGALWIRAKQLISDQPLIGHGPSYWVRQIATSEIVSNYSAHNLWLEIMVATGIIGVVALAAGVVIAFGQADPAVRPLILTGLVTLLACGVFEAPVMPYRLSLTPGVFIALLMMTGLRGGPKRTSRAQVRASQPVVKTLALAGSSPTLH